MLTRPAGLPAPPAARADLEQVYADFGSSIGFDEEPTDIAYKFAGASLVILTIGAALSLWWLQRLP